MSFEQGRESLDGPITPKSTNISVSSPTPERPTRSYNDAQVYAPSDDVRGRLDRVLQSDIGINTLLTRLKQSISSVKEFSVFLRERANLEEKHANGLKKLTRSTHELVRRPENRQGSFASNYEEMTRIQDRMADNGMEYAHNLHIMAEELQELAAGSERGRKQWKHTGLDAEQRARDAEAAMEKAKNRYFSFADQYDRARTGERQSGKFGLKGPKSAAQQEDSLLAKAQNADAEYSDRVSAAQAQREELLRSSRPQTIRELQNIILECDAGLGMQLQKFSVLTEKLLLNNGLSVSPLKNQATGGSASQASMRELAGNVDNHHDFESFVLSHMNNVGQPPNEIKYEKHPALVTSTQPTYGNMQPVGPGSVSQTGNSLERRETGMSSFNGPTSQSGQTSGILPSHSPSASGSYAPVQSSPSRAPQLPQIGALGGRSSLDSDRRDMSFSGRPENDYRNVSGPHQHRPGQMSYSGPTTTPQYGAGLNQQHDSYAPVAGRAQQGLGSTPYTIGQGPSSMSQYPTHGRETSLGQQGDIRAEARGPAPQSNYPPYQSDGRGLPSQNGGFRAPGGRSSPSAIVAGAPPVPASKGAMARSLPPLKPVFGVSLDDLFRRDGAAVPAIVYQCVQAVDMFGLETEGIYRTAGTAQHIMDLRALFDHDSSQVDFRNPAAFHNDIAAVTTLLKHFFRDLKDPLLTSAQYNSFIQAAKLDDDIIRRDSLHAIINSLPDPNYATLRTLTLHLHRVAQHSAQNRMTASNLAIIFGPTLMTGPSNSHPSDIGDSAYQAKVIETILGNTYQIFDDDD